MESRGKSTTVVLRDHIVNERLFNYRDGKAARTKRPYTFIRNDDSSLWIYRREIFGTLLSLAHISLARLWPFG